MISGCEYFTLFFSSMNNDFLLKVLQAFFLNIKFRKSTKHMNPRNLGSNVELFDLSLHYETHQKFESEQKDEKYGI